jgi:hypothetical protein
MLGVDQFSFRNMEKRRLHSRCWACSREFGRQHYARQKQEYLERNRHNNPPQRLAARQFVQQFLLEHPCVQCGDPVVLEFNHLDATTKSGNVCDLVHSRSSLRRLWAENVKCEVLCANCHQRHTTLARPVHYKRGESAGGIRAAAIVRNQRFVLEYLARATCVDCDEGDPLVLQFD